MSDEKQDAGDGRKKKNWTEWAVEKLAGMYTDPVVVAKKLALASAHCHLVGGLSVVPLVEGYEILITVIPIDPDDVYPVNPIAKKIDAGEEVYVKDVKPGGTTTPKWGVGKSTLMRVAGAAQVEWGPFERIDDDEDQDLVEVRVMGRYQGVDGTFRPVPGHRQIDLREGSRQIASKKELELERMRENILRLAETKAKLRGIREAFGIPSGMTKKQLGRPFVVARQVFTGRSDNAEIRSKFASVIAAKQLMAGMAAFGADRMPTEVIAALFQAPAPPQIVEAKAVSQPKLPAAKKPAQLSAPSSERRPQPARQSKPAQSQERAQRPATAGEPLVPFGKNKGKPVSSVDDESLDWLLKAVRTSLEDESKAAWREKNQRDLDLLLKEKGRRGRPKDEAPSADPAPAAEPPKAEPPKAEEPPAADRVPGDDFDEDDFPDDDEDSQ